MTPDELLRRQAMREAVKSCQGCELHKTCKSPVPFSGPSPNGIVVVGEAPGKQEDEKGQVFVGPAGRLLRELMFEVELNPADVTFINTVSCYPGRTPTQDEVKACEVNLLGQLEVVGPRWVLLAGKVASGLLGLRDDLSMAQIRGMWFRYQNSLSGIDAWCIPTYHPSAYLRSQDPKIRWFIRSDLETLRFYSLGVFEPEQGQWCVKCERSVMGEGRLAVIWEGGVGWCMEHAGSRRIKKWRKASQERML